MGAFSACSLWCDGQAAGIAAPPTLRRPAAASSARLSIGAVKRCNSGLGAARQASCLCRCTIDAQIAGGSAGGRPDATRAQLPCMSLLLAPRRLLIQISMALLEVIRRMWRALLTILASLFRVRAGRAEWPRSSPWAAVLTGRRP